MLSGVWNMACWETWFRTRKMKMSPGPNVLLRLGFKSKPKISLISVQDVLQDVILYKHQMQYLKFDTLT